MKKYCKIRHSFYFRIARPIAKFFVTQYNFKYKLFKIPKGENYLFLANHQTALDPAFLALSVNRPLYIVANETLFDGSFASKALSHCFAPIKKKKAEADISCVRSCLKIAREGGSVAVFPEGNRSWADIPFNIEPSIVKLVRLLRLPVALYNFCGGYGVDPRWSEDLRKGQFTGEVKEVLSVAEIESLSDKELLTRIKTALRVVDGESGKTYISDKKAERLERVLFVCPACGAISSFRSEGNIVKCSKCGVSAEYTSDLHLCYSDKEKRFERLSDWYAFQLDYLKNRVFDKKETIFTDKNVVMFKLTNGKKNKVCCGNLKLTFDKISVGQTVVPLIEVSSASLVGGKSIILNLNDYSYVIKGDERFNALKYVLTFNKLDTGIKGEKYYGLEL